MQEDKYVATRIYARTKLTMHCLAVRANMAETVFQNKVQLAVDSAVEDVVDAQASAAVLRSVCTALLGVFTNAK